MVARVKPPFVSLLEFIRCKLSLLVVHITGVTTGKGVLVVERELAGCADHTARSLIVGRER